MTDPVTEQVHQCGHCGGSHAGACYRLKRIEYHPDGKVKAVEYYAINRPLSAIVSPYRDGHQESA